MTIDTNKDWDIYRITNLGTPISTYDATTKAYVDAGDDPVDVNVKYTNADINVDGTFAADYGSFVTVLIADGSVTGSFTLGGSPVTDLEAATKKYVDSQGTGALSLLTIDTDKNWATYKICNMGSLGVTGSVTAGSITLTDGSVTGSFTLGGAPESNLEAATKKYVDDNAGATALSALTIDADKNWATYRICNMGSLGVTGSLSVGSVTVSGTIMVAGGSLTVGSMTTLKAVDGSITGSFTLGGSPITAPEAATKGYVDNKTLTTTLTFAVTGTLTAGTDKAPTIISPCSLTITKAKTVVKTAPSNGSVTCDVNRDGTTIFTTQGSRPLIGSGTTTDDSDTPDETALTEGSLVTIDIDTVGGTVAGKDLTLELVCEQAI